MKRLGVCAAPVLDETDRAPDPLRTRAVNRPDDDARETRNCEAFSSFSDRETYSCPGGVVAALTPPVRRMASADLTGFAGSGEVATALLSRRTCTGLGVSSTIAALGLPA